MKLSMKLGIQGEAWAPISAFFRHADEIPAYAAAWVNDHLYNPGFPRRSDDPATYEAYTALAALAAETSRIRLGAMVGANLFRNPALVARMAATIDHISGGRFELGMGAGWHEREHEDNGIDLLSPGRRVTAFEEALVVLRSLLSEKETTFSGEHYTFRSALSEPKPLQTRVPLTIGAFRPRMLGVTARFADHWNFDGKDPELFAATLATLHEACERVGRDPSEIEVSVQFWPQRKPDLSLTELCGRFRDHGADHMILGFLHPDHDLLESAAEELAGL